MQVDDKMIELAHSPSGSEGDDAAVDGGGITLKSSDSDKTILWTNSTDQWTYNQGINITSGNLVVAGDIDLEGSIDVNGTANLDAVDIDGAVDMASTLTVGGRITSSYSDASIIASLQNTHATGYGLKLMATAGASSRYIATFNDKDDNVKAQILGDGSATFAGDLDVDGTTNLDNTDIDGTFTQDAGNVVFNEDSGDYDFRVESNGNTHMLFVDGGNNRIGINESTPL